MLRSPAKSKTGEKSRPIKFKDIKFKDKVKEMSRKSIHVQPSENGWALKRSDSNQTDDKYPTKREATKAARQIASEQNLDVIIFERGRTYTEIRTFDPKTAGRQRRSPARRIQTASLEGTNNHDSSLQKKAELWRQWAAGHQPNRQGLSDEAISRESIYGERG